MKDCDLNPPRIRLAAFYLEDFDRITPRDITAIGSLDVLRTMVDPKFARSGFLGDRLLGAAGVIKLCDGVGLAWAFIDGNMPPQFGVALIRACRDGLKEVMAQGPFHRIQADVCRGYRPAIRLARVIGFKYEGSMDAYGVNGADFDRYSIIDRTLLPPIAGA